jgi:Secretion system C-terminal sorting domain
MKTTITKKLFLLLIGGIFSFSIANAQGYCDCVASHPAGYCYVDSHGNNRCVRYNSNYNCHHCGFRIGENESGMGIEASLQVYPNPVAGSTTVSFSVDQSQKVSLRIFDMSGRLVTTLADASFEEGEYEIVWNAANVNAGIYFLQVQSEENFETIKLAVTK